MEDTLLIGDRIVIRIFPRVNLKRGDMVVFHYPLERNQIFVKRVIGMPGDHLRIVSRVVYRNGTVLQEPYAIHRSDTEDAYRDNLPTDPAELRFMLPGVVAAATEMFSRHVLNGELVVPANRYFVLGDNRDNSLDSRYWGFVDESDVMCKPVMLFYSVATPNDRGKAELRPDRLFKGL